MKFIVSIILTSAFAFALSGYLDWWSIAIAAFLVALCIPQKPWKSWLSGFLSLFILWGGYSLYIHHKNGEVFARKIADIFFLQGNAYLLIGITALIGALVAGFASMSASYLRYKKEK